jgi:hypothetical protein
MLGDRILKQSSLQPLFYDPPIICKETHVAVGMDKTVFLFQLNRFALTNYGKKYYKMKTIHNKDRVYVGYFLRAFSYKQSRKLSIQNLGWGEK